MLRQGKGDTRCWRKKVSIKKSCSASLAGVAVVAAALVGYRAFGWGAMGPVNSLKLDLSRPDALVRTKSLSTLPRDLLTVPLARDVLREEFLFYYEQSEDRLGLKGSLRRIAYEHQLGWGDQLLRMVLDQPAEVALWRDADGSLKHFAIAVSRNQLTRILEEAGKVALKDTQMSVAGSLRVDGDSVPVYALNYAWQRTLLFAAHGQRLVILSHPGMLYGGAEGKKGDGTAEKTVVSLLGKDADKQNVFHPQFHLDNAAPEGHSIAVKADFLSFGYQPFFGALGGAALRFSTRRLAVKSAAQCRQAEKRDAYDSSALWPVLPHSPSACFSVPVDWTALQPVLKRLGSKTSEPVAPLAEHLQGPAAACWYGNSRLHTPVFVATRKPQAGDDALYAQPVRGGHRRQGPGAQDCGQGWRRFALGTHDCHGAGADHARRWPWPAIPSCSRPTASWSTRCWRCAASRRRRPATCCPMAPARSA